jgi:hypothetical protein
MFSRLLFYLFDLLLGLLRLDLAEGDLYDNRAAQFAETMDAHERIHGCTSTALVCTVSLFSQP